MRAVREAMSGSVREAVPDSVRELFVMPGHCFPVIIRLDQQLVRAECMRSVQYVREAVPEAVPDSLLTLQQIVR